MQEGYKAVTVKKNRQCSQCSESIVKGEKAFYRRYRVYERIFLDHHNFYRRLLRWGGDWLHADPLCYVPAEHRENCRAGTHSPIDEMSMELFTGDPPTPTGNKFCEHCGEPTYRVNEATE